MLPITIRPVNHGPKNKDRNRYCGPSAISALTGCTTGEAAYLIRHLTGKKMVAGTTDGQVLKALDTFNIRGVSEKVEKTPEGKKPTLANWLKTPTKQRTDGTAWLVVAGNPWQIIRGRRYGCGISGEVVSIRDEKVKRRARVARVYHLLVGSDGIVKPAKHPILKNRHVEKVTKRKEAATGPRAQFVKQAKACGWDWQLSNDGYLEIEPCEEFPEGLMTAHYGWDETWDRVKDCLADPSLISEEGYYAA
jgi:hypothetical protein